MHTSEAEKERTEALASIRAEIDRIDAEVISLLGQRANYVQQAGHYKPSAARVRVPERERQVIARACQLATEHGLDPSFVEQLYLMMLDYFVKYEQEHVRRRIELSDK